MAVKLSLLSLNDIKELHRQGVVSCCDLHLKDDYRITDQIFNSNDPSTPATIVPIQIPSDMSIYIYQDEGIIETRTDSYGSTLTYATASSLRKLKLDSDTSHINKAIKAYIDALPDDMPIVLYWH